MPKYLLVDDFDGKLVPIAEIVVDNEDIAKDVFFVDDGWPFGEVISEADYLNDMKNESDLNALECQSGEQ